MSSARHWPCTNAVESIRMLYGLGLRMDQVADVVGASRDQVKRFMQKHCIARRQKGFHRNLPVKFCISCGKQLERKVFAGVPETPQAFLSRKTCGLKCGYASRWLRPTKTDGGGRDRARKVKPKGPCELCRRTKNIDVHHKDENPQNNAKSNLVRLCRSCHKKVHAGTVTL